MALDSPSTVALCTSTLVDLAGFAATDIPHEILATAGHVNGHARLVLVDARELAWHRARCRGNHSILAPADPVLVSLTSLQHWLCQRLQAPPDHDDEGAGGNETTAAYPRPPVMKEPARLRRFQDDPAAADLPVLLTVDETAQLRHTFCCHLAMRGAPARAIQELAGHVDVGTTQRYMHLSPAATASAIRLLDQEAHAVPGQTG